MPMESKYDGVCKDCGATHKIGDEIDKNANDHWCKDWDHCQGAKGSDSQSKEVEAPPGKIRSGVPTVEELQEALHKEYDTENRRYVNQRFDIIESYVNQREACESVGITDPITIGMIWNNYIRRTNQ